MARSAQTGVFFMIAATTVFAIQDGISKLLGSEYPAIVVVMIRYWAFAVFVLAISAAAPGGLAAAARTKRPVIQCLRGVLLVVQVVLMTIGFVRLGLAESHAVMAVAPLLTAALGAAALGERIDRLQWAAIAVGFMGVLILIKPGVGVFDLDALIPLLCAMIFATYNVLTRHVGAEDSPATSFFYTGMAGAAAITLVGPWFWVPMAQEDWGWMALLCVTGAGGHYLLIKAYAAAAAGELQPFAYLQLVIASLIGVAAFGEVLDAPLLVGAAIVVGAGLCAYAAGRRARPAAA